MDPARNPYFRFYPGAYEAEFEESAKQCEVCGDPCGWRYTGIIYSKEYPEVVCAACIHSGRLRAYVGARMSLHDVELEGADSELQTELLERTPGVASFNPFPWPVRNGVPLAFVGHGDDEAVQRIPEAHAATAQAALECGFDDIALPTPYALVFKGLDEAHYAVVFDFD